MESKGIETSFHLLFAYDKLAYEYTLHNEPREAFSEDGLHGILKRVPSLNYNNYYYAFALLNINAAILEGVMRSILFEIVSDEAGKQVDAGMKAGRTERSSPEKLLNKFFIEVDAQGGWEHLKEQYANYLGLPIDKKTQSETKDAISALFLLRNIFAHGTALIHPSQPIPEDLKDEPLFKWQSRLQTARVYLQKNFGHENVFDNLAEFQVPAHFLKKTQDFLLEILPEIAHKPKRSEKTIASLKTYSFGYVNF